jgi:hypothetical protein
VDLAWLRLEVGYIVGRFTHGGKYGTPGGGNKACPRSGLSYTRAVRTGCLAARRLARYRRWPAAGNDRQRGPSAHLRRGLVHLPQPVKEGEGEPRRDKRTDRSLPTVPELADRVVSPASGGAVVFERNRVDLSSCDRGHSRRSGCLHRSRAARPSAAAQLAVVVESAKEDKPR